MAEAMAWVSRITTVSLEMVLPGLAGFWLDRQFGTRFLLTLLGFALGMTVGMWHLLAMTKVDQNRDQNGDQTKQPPQGQKQDPKDS